MPKPRRDCGQLKLRRRSKPGAAYGPDRAAGGASSPCTVTTGGAGDAIVTLLVGPTGRHLARVTHGLSDPSSARCIARQTSHGASTVGTSRVTILRPPMKADAVQRFTAYWAERGLAIVQLYEEGAPMRTLGGAFVMSVRCTLGVEARRAALDALASSDRVLELTER